MRDRSTTGGADGGRSRSDYRWLWGAYTASSLGSGIGAGALPLVAVLVLHSSTFGVSLLAALSAAASAAIALPFAPRIEFRYKRPIMVAADGVRFVALGSVPAAAAIGVLTFGQLCIVGAVQAAANLVFVAASTAHLKGLTTADERLGANSQFAMISWLSQTAGPALGGVLIGMFGVTVTLACDAVSFLLSALGIGRLGSIEPAPPRRQAGQRRIEELTAGWRYLFADKVLWALFCNAMLFGGTIMLVSPLLAVLVLRTLHLGPLGYGVILGAPCLGGLIGSRMAPALSQRFGPHKVLLWSGALRTPWMLLLPLAGQGAQGLTVVLIAETGLLLAAGIFNPCFMTYRMNATSDQFMARVSSSWSIAAKLLQPVFILLGGTLALILGLRMALGISGVICCLSALLLPWNHLAAVPHAPPRDLHPATAS